MIKELLFAHRKQDIWEKISSELRWTEEMLTHYADKVNWKNISSNEKVIWTESLIHKFANRLDWNELSKNKATALACPNLVCVFALNWHWNEKTKHIDWTPEFVEEMKEYLNWEWLFKAASYEELEYLLKNYFKFISRVK
ncbi:MAG: hypothetical protein MJ003_06370 [Paludibacteraceae bacterium]|nr:hypothetical protein [Paludibacteraceae bacterium]